MMKNITKWVALILFIGIGYLFFDNYPKLNIVSAYSAKKMCSCTFIADRDQASIQTEDLGNGFLSLSSTKIDRENKRVTSSVFWLQSRTAEYRGKLGCVLLKGKDDYNVSYPIVDAPPISLDTVNFPYGDNVFKTSTKELDLSSLDILDTLAFDPNGEMTNKKTRALLVLHKDTLVYEKYANGYDENTEMLGWSMSKSIMNTWVGMMQDEGKISIHDKGLFPEWMEDERKDITVNHLLQMSSGLEWTEDYGNISPATTMLYNSEANGEVAKEQPLESKPGEHWEYSSGTSNIISLILRNRFDTHQNYLAFLHDRIFGPLNMKSAVMEVDESGSYIGSSYTYATPRDWARYGTLYLRNGNWNGKQLLSKEWIDYTRTPAPQSNGCYHPIS